MKRIAYVNGEYVAAADAKEKSLHVHLVEDIRWMLCNIKTNSLIGNKVPGKYWRQIEAAYQQLFKDSNEK